MSKTKGLDHSAYGGVPGDKYVPYVSAQEVMPESTVTAILFGVIFSIVFARNYRSIKQSSLWYDYCYPTLHHIHP